MKKVFIIHGFQGSPNGGWRPWLMAELEKQDIYACAISMPDPENPLCSEWIDEISRHVERNSHDEVYLVGHSLGGPTILRYLENTGMKNIAGVILISSPSEKNDKKNFNTFLDAEFNFEKIKSSCHTFVIIHGDNDPLVPVDNAQYLFEKLGGSLIMVKDGGHLNGSSGCFTLPECLDALNNILKS